MHNEIGNGKVCEFTYINDFVIQQKMLQLFAFKEIEELLETLRDSV